HNATSSSPMIIGDKVYVSTSNGVDWGHTNIPNPRAPIFIALDKNTGELIGEEASGISTRIFHGAWSSPTYGEHNGQNMLFYGGPDGWAYGFNPTPELDADGFGIFQERWRADLNPEHYRYREDGTPIRYARPDGPSEVISTPVYHDGMLYVTIGQDPEHGEGVGNLVAIDVTGEGDVTDSEIVWQHQDIYRSMSTPSVVDDLLFVADFSGFIYCFDAKTGELHWKYDSLSHIWGSTLVADGKVYVGNEDGDVLIFEASKEKQLINAINMRDPIYSTPVVANGALYIATQTQLYAVEAEQAEQD
ncbi:MAG: PQQ-binding-like beta-propeller repeat protein, partial [Phycisphaeraceae bacterium]